ncbi:MAG: phytoene/squalene synthase family protein [bacterium]
MTLAYLEQKYNLADGFELAKAVTQDYAKSFYFASRFLPKNKRQDAYNIYAFCRLSDNLADDTDTWDMDKRLELINAWEREVKNVFKTGKTENLILKVTHQTALKYNIPKKYFFELIEGVKGDLTKLKFNTYDELDNYCYLVAAVPGLMISYILGFTDPKALKYASEFGKAMQITNILRDLKEDWQRGRIYLPQKDLEKFGYSETDLSQNIVNDHFKNLLKAYIEKAKNMYTFGYQGLQYLTPEGRFCAKLCGLVYSAILDKIEQQDYDVFNKRARTSTLEKLWLVGRALIS